MGLRTALVNTGDGFIDRILCVSGAVTLSQAPEFIQQYLQRLGGHVDEARRQVDQYRQVALQSNLTLDQLITQTTANPAPTVSRLGQVMNEATLRLHSLQDAQFAISHAPAWKRPWVFIEYVDTQIAHNTWAIFRPGVPVTMEGLAYALLGMVIFLGLYHSLVRYPVSAGYRRWRRKKTPVEAPLPSHS